MTTTNPMYQLHNRIEAALIATYGPIEKWDEDYGIGLSDGQYKSLAATMAEWFIDWIKDEGMVRTPGTVEISRENLWQARIWVALWLTDDDVDTDEVDRVVDVIDAALANEDTNG